MTRASRKTGDLELSAFLALALMLHMVCAFALSLKRDSGPEFFQVDERQREITPVTLATVVLPAAAPAATPPPVVRTPPRVRPPTVSTRPPAPQVRPRDANPRPAASRPHGNPPAVVTSRTGGYSVPVGTGTQGGPGGAGTPGGGGANGGGGGAGRGPGGNAEQLMVVWRLDYDDPKLGSSENYDTRMARLMEMGVHNPSRDLIMGLESGNYRTWQDVCKLMGLDYQELLRRPVVPPVYLRCDMPPIPADRYPGLRDGAGRTIVKVFPNGTSEVQMVGSGGEAADTIVFNVSRHITWLPGMQNGTPTPMTVGLRISFRIYSMPR